MAENASSKLPPVIKKIAGTPPLGLLGAFTDNGRYHGLNTHGTDQYFGNVNLGQERQALLFGRRGSWNRTDVISWSINDNGEATVFADFHGLANVGGGLLPEPVTLIAKAEVNPQDEEDVLLSKLRIQQRIPKTPELLKSFKAAYNAMDEQGIAHLFAEQAQFQGTAEKEYRQVLRQNVAEYFQNIAESRQSQTLKIEAFDTIDDELIVHAVFESVAKDGTKNDDKPVQFTIRHEEVDGVQQILEFRSEPR